MLGKVDVGLDNAKLLSAENIYAISCHTARVLGPYIISRGYSRGYVGFSDEFVFAIKSIKDPLIDVYGRLFFMPIIYGFKKLLESRDAEETSRSMKTLFREIGDYAFNNLGKDGIYLASLLYYIADIVRGIKAKERV